MLMFDVVMASVSQLCSCSFADPCFYSESISGVRLLFAGSFSRMKKNISNSVTHRIVSLSLVTVCFSALTPSADFRKGIWLAEDMCHLF